MNKILLIILVLISTVSFGQTVNYAKAIKLRGKVNVVFKGKTTKLKKGQKIPAGAVLHSKEKSFAVIQMSDKTKLTLGPSSSIEVKVLSAKGKPGLINLLKGQLRSKVKPDKVKKGNKLFIKANMAALGVRGTETVITYNPKNKSFTTGGLTGEVAITQLKNKNAGIKELKTKLSKSNPDLIILPKQYFSSVKLENDKSFKITKPQKINSVQYFALLRNPTPNFKNTKKPLNNYRPISLPNLPPISDDSVISETVSNEVVKNAREEQAGISTPGVTKNSETPIAGALVDFNTGVIINPSPTDPIDPVTGMRTPSNNMGTISADGSYQPPKGLELKSNGEFAVDPKASKSDRRSLASIPGQKVAVNGEIKLPKIPKLEEINIEMLDFNDGEIIENQNSQINQEITSSESETAQESGQSESNGPQQSDSRQIENDQAPENSTDLPKNIELGDNIINVENDCPNRKLCDNFNSVSPTTTDIITKTAVQFNIIIRK